MTNRLSLSLLAALVLAGTLLLGAQVRPAQAYPGADGLTSGVQCNPDGTTSVFMNWTTYDAGIQYLDWSSVSSSFAPGSFQTAGPLAISVSSVAWSGFAPQATYYVRVNTLIGNTWYPSSALTVNTFSCPIVRTAPVLVPIPVPMPYPVPPIPPPGPPGPTPPGPPPPPTPTPPPPPPTS
jgi:hypothetical protein